MSDVCSDSVRLEWQAPPCDGGAEVTSYVIEKCEVGVGQWLYTATSHMTHMTIRRLQENKEYQFRILAENAHGISDPSEETDPVITQEPKIDIDYDKLGK